VRFLAAISIASLACLGADPDSSAVSILEQRCHQCHAGKTKMGGVDLTHSVSVTAIAGMLAGAISYTGKIKMPPGGALPAAEAEALRAWLTRGAPWPSGRQATSAAVVGWWAFRKPARPAVPAGKENPIDAFVSGKLSERGLAPAAEADRVALIRRATYDLHGLPPSYTEISEFASDGRPDAYSRLIERLLDSPRYGEKWGKHWLDLVRYGDTSGFEQDPYLLYAWRYRDYVIESFNSDKPYDRFVKEQIAGDELYPEDPKSQQGTGYFTVGTNRDMLYKVEDVNRIEQLTDFVDTTSSVFLGLTVACARCHDHKFDAIPQRDYYRMQAIFAPFLKTRVFLHYDMARGYDLQENTRSFRLYETGDQLTALLGPHRARLREERLTKLSADVVAAIRTPDERKTPQQKALADANARKVEPSDEEVYAQLSKDELERLHRIERRLIGVFKTYAPGPFSPGLTDVGREAPRTYIPGKGTEEIEPGFLTALGGGEIPEPPADSPTTLRRKALAEWIASPSNPLTARVMVNRIWQYHFGRGIVATPSDFGTRAAAPTHAELLDWLATEFVERKWSIKAMHRLIMNSEAYRRSARGSVKARETDPENTLLSHFTRRRLEAEEIRDSILGAAGALNPKTGGRPVVPALPAEELYGMSQPTANAWIVTENAEEHDRRSIYMISRRNFRMPLLEAFDRPEGVLSCARRDSSTTAPQSLSLLNGRFTRAQADRFAVRIEASAEPVRDAWRAILGREPDERERSRSRDFIAEQTARLGDRRAALAELARAMFNLNEFLYVE
jgi:hypothetical protein